VKSIKAHRDYIVCLLPVFRSRNFSAKFQTAHASNLCHLCMVTVCQSVLSLSAILLLFCMGMHYSVQSVERTPTC